MFNARIGTVSGKCIEADQINIEYAQIDVLRGTDIKVGAGCDIGLIEYSGNLTVDPDAKVGEMRQIEK